MEGKVIDTPSMKANQKMEKERVFYLIMSYNYAGD